jgi:hypothetical protein
VHWIAANREAPDPVYWSAVRFDVLSVVRGSAGFEVTHLVGAF